MPSKKKNSVHPFTLQEQRDARRAVRRISIDDSEGDSEEPSYDEVDSFDGERSDSVRLVNLQTRSPSATLSSPLDHGSPASGLVAIPEDEPLVTATPSRHEKLAKLRTSRLDRTQLILDQRESRQGSAGSIDAFIRKAVADANDTVNLWIEQSIRVNCVSSTWRPKASGTTHCTTYGQVEFDRPSAGVRRSAKYIRVASSTDPFLIRELLTEVWELEPPRLLVSVLGSDHVVNLPPTLHDRLSKGLKSVARSKTTWLTTSGLNTGIQKYVGVVTKQLGPTIGIVPWSTLAGKRRLETVQTNGFWTPVRGNTVFYGAPADYPEDERPNCLEANHTHFICVDEGAVSEGTNVHADMRVAIEQTICQLTTMGEFGLPSQVKSITLLINGGLDALESCLSSISRGTPLIIVSGSGGMADLLAYTWNLCYKPTEDLSEDKLDWQIRCHCVTHAKQSRVDERTVERVKEQLLECVSNYDLVVVYSTDSVGATQQSLEGIILNTLLPDNPISTQAPQVTGDNADIQAAVKLELAMLWDRTDVARSILAQGRFLYGLLHRAESGGLQQAKIDMLMWALVHHRVQVIKLMVETLELNDTAAFLKMRSFKQTYTTNTPVPDMCRRSAKAFMSDIPDPVLFRGNLPQHLQAETLLCLIGENSQVHDDAEDVQVGEFIVRTILARGYMVAYGAQWEPQHTVCIPHFEDLLVVTLAENFHHKWAREQVEDGVAVEEDADIGPFKNLSPEKQEHLLAQARGVLLHLLQKKVRIWSPDRFEALFISLSIDQRVSGSLGPLVESGHFWRAEIQKYLGTLIGREYRSDLVDFDALNPFFVLMLWSILSQSLPLAEFFWTQLKRSSLHSALAAAAVCHSLSQSSNRFVGSENLAVFVDFGNKFRKLACDITRKCQSADSEMAEQLVRMQTPEVGYIPPWMLAYQINFGEFTALPASLRVLSREWQGQVVSKNTIKIIICALFLPYGLIPIPKKPAFLRRILLGIDTSEHGQPATSYWQKFVRRAKAVYDSPMIAFWLEVFSFLCVCLLYSYVAMEPSQSIHQTIHFHDFTSTCHVLSWLWLFTMIVDEFRQAVVHGFEAWAESGWNIWDFLMYAVLASSFFLRSSSSNQNFETSRILDAIGVVMLWTRLARYFAVDSSLGPKVLMLRRMVSDIRVFASLLFTVLIGYGVAAYILIWPNRTFDAESITDVLFMPYFQVYGELFLGEIQESTDCLGGSMRHCGVSQGPALVLFLALYMLVANILLVNLLIASMTSTYEEVNEESQQTWSLLYVDILIEFRDKWLFPAPFNVIRNIYMLVVALARWWDNLVEVGEFKLPLIKMHVRRLPSEKAARLNDFVEAQTREYFNMGELALVDERSSEIDVLRSDVFKLQIALRKQRKQQQKQFQMLLQALQQDDGADPVT